MVNIWLKKKKKKKNPEKMVGDDPFASPDLFLAVPLNFSISTSCRNTVLSGFYVSCVDICPGKGYAAVAQKLYC